MGVLSVLCVLPVSFSAFAEGDLTEESMNPLSTIVSLPFENNTLFNLGPSESTANVLNIKPIYPAEMGDWILLNRAIIPVVYTQGQDEIVFDEFTWGSGNPGSFDIGSAFGLGDITYQGFVRPKKQGKIQYGLGGSLVLPTHTEDRFGTDKWSLGPAAVAFAPVGNWVLGGIMQNIWSVAGDSDAADVNIFSLQLAINYRLGNRWYFTSAPMITANWEAEKDNRWTVPLGGGIGRIFKLDKMALAVDAGAYYNVESPRFANDWYSQILVNFLFPKKR